MMLRRIFNSFIHTQRATSVATFARRFSTAAPTGEQIEFEAVVEADNVTKKLSGKKGQRVAEILKNAELVPCECGYQAECSTCIVEVKDQSHYDQLQQEQPMQRNEKITLGLEDQDPSPAMEKCRLSCQLKLSPLFKNIKIYI